MQDMPSPSSNVDSLNPSLPSHFERWFIKPNETTL